MDLRSKLSRMSSPRPSATEATRASESTDSMDSTDAMDSMDSMDRTGRPELALLRARLAEMMSRSRSKPSPRPGERSFARRDDARDHDDAREQDAFVDGAPDEYDGAPLPFEAIETELGTLHVRTVRHAPSARVGHVHVGQALRATGDALSVLALDRSLAGLDAKGALYLDTESTGLAGGTGTIPFLVGLGWFEGSEMVVEQLLLRELGQEAPILARVAERIARASMLVSFNGKSFDLPLLRTRFVMNRVAAPDGRPHLDLLHVARRIHRVARGGAPGREPRVGPWIESVADDEGNLRRRTSCRLIALEEQLLGFQRIDDVPSSEIPARYGHFIRTGEGGAIRAVCEHNLWDVVSMAALLGLYGCAVLALDAEVTESAFAQPLGAADLVGVAMTLHRAGDLRRARSAADAAMTGNGDERERTFDREIDRLARKARGAIAKGARDHDAAIVDFEAVAAAHGDEGARLELAKLYEHRAKDPLRALEHVLAGTGEGATGTAHRRARLERKAARASLTLPLRARKP